MVDVLRQDVALRDVEDGEALEKGHGLGLVAFGLGALQFVLGMKRSA